MKQITTVLLATLVLLTACSSFSPIPTISPSKTDANAITADNASMLVESESLAREGAGPVTALAFTPDGTQLRAVHARTPMLLQWDLNTRTMLGEYQLDSVGLGAVAFDRDANQAILSGMASDFAMSDKYLTGILPKQALGPYDAVYVLDASNGHLLNFLNPVGFGREFHGVASSEDGGTIAAVGYNTTENSYELLVFKRGTSSLVPFRVSFHTPHWRPVSGMDFALDAEGRLLAKDSGNNSIQLWDLSTGNEWGTLKISTNQANEEFPHSVDQLAIAPTRQWLASFSFLYPESHYVILWRLDKKAVQWQVESSFRFVYTFAFNPSGDLLAIGAGDGLHLWSVATGEEVMSFPGEEVFAVRFSQDGSLLAWGDWPGSVHLAELSKK